MSLDTLARDIEKNREQGEQLQNQWYRRIADIKADDSLSDTGKRQALDASYNDFLGRARELRENEVRIAKAKLQDLQRQVDSKAGSTSSDIIAFRDAQDRADRLTRDEAINVLERAMRQGDTSLAHAVFRRATEARWPEVAAAFTAQNPELADVVRDINELQALISDSSFERTVKYAIFAA